MRLHVIYAVVLVYLSAQGACDDRKWQQCGGKDYRGDTNCPSGWTCQYQNLCMNHPFLHRRVQMGLWHR